MQTRPIAALALAAVIVTSAFAQERSSAVSTALSSGTVGGYVDSSAQWHVPANLSLTPSVPVSSGVEFGSPVLTLTLGASGNRLQDTLNDGIGSYPSAYPVVEPPAEIVHGFLDLYGTDGTQVFTPQFGTMIAETILRPLRDDLVSFPRGTPIMVVPEPSTFALLSLGVVSLVCSMRSRNRHPRPQHWTVMVPAGES